MFLPVHAGAADAPAPDLHAPAVQPKLLFASRLGGAGDQWFCAVDVHGTSVRASNPDGLSLSVTVGKDDQVTSSHDGHPGLPGKVVDDLPNGGRNGAYTFGYRQVDANLQAPFLEGPGWKLWGWTLAQTKAAKVQYGPPMADSRIKGVFILPKGDLFVVGYTDGGNTILRAHPANPDLTLPVPISEGGGGGRSSWCFRIAPNGRYQRVMALRNKVTCVATDAWGRVLAGGSGVVKPGSGAIGGGGDGAGLVMTDAAWDKALLKAHFGPPPGGDGGGTAWAIDIDSASGICAIAGFCTGAFHSLHAEQEKPGGGKDAFLAVLRLWTPEDVAAAKAAEQSAKP